MGGVTDLLRVKAKFEHVPVWLLVTVTDIIMLFHYYMKFKNIKWESYPLKFN